MTRFKRIVVLGLVGALLAGTAAACSEIAEPDKVGLWYASGNSDGNHFDHCVAPGHTDDVAWNDYVKWVPDNVRTWNIATEGGDSNQALRVTAKPETGQQSGLEVLVWTQTTLKLNTACGDNERDGNSPLVNWWENLGKRYEADTDAGWRNMLLNTVVPALEKAKNVLREYTADELVQGTVWSEAEARFSATFSTELTRLSGGEYFCGPSFNRADPDNCPSVAVSIKDVDYADPGIQEARNEKQKAIEKAAAALIEAQGVVAAAAEKGQLYSNEAWVALETIRMIAEACEKSPGCQIIVGSDGNLVLTGGR
jgi:hypothetical protein